MRKNSDERHSTSSRKISDETKKTKMEESEKTQRKEGRDVKDGQMRSRKKESSHENLDKKEKGHERPIGDKENNRKESRDVRKERSEKREAEKTVEEEKRRRSSAKDMLYPMRARKDNALAIQTSKKTESHPRNQSNKEESNPTKEFGQRSKEYIPPPDGFGDQPDSGDLMRESNERLISFIEKV